MNSKKIYESPEMTLLAIGREDILTASTGDSEIIDWAW